MYIRLPLDEIITLIDKTWKAIFNKWVKYVKVAGSQVIWFSKMSLIIIFLMSLGIASLAWAKSPLVCEAVGSEEVDRLVAHSSSSTGALQPPEQGEGVVSPSATTRHPVELSGALHWDRSHLHRYIWWACIHLASQGAAPTHSAGQGLQGHPGDIQQVWHLI